MKSNFFHISALLVVSFLSTYLFFVDNSWHFFLRDSFALELILMFLGAVCAGLLIYFKCRSVSKSQAICLLGLLALNMLVVIPPIVNYAHPFVNIQIYIILHVILFSLMLWRLNNRLVFTVLSGYMICCSAIAYRLDTILYPCHDGESLCVGNLEMLISVLVLFVVASSVLIFWNFKEN